MITLDTMRRYAVARTLFTPTTLPKAIDRLGFVQADPIRAPARAQDLILRHRVKAYQAGELERRYERLAVDEDCFVNYGFLPRRHLGLLHPRTPRRVWDAAQRRRAADVLAFVREQGPCHPKQVQALFDHGRTRNAWGGTSNAVTALMDGMHYRGLLRVVRREGGQRLYGVVTHVEDPRSAADKADALIDLVLAKYAPLPSRSLGFLCSALAYGAPQLRAETRHAQQRARQRLPGLLVDGVQWLWPAGENPTSRRWRLDEQLRLLAPFDPVVWDRQRFELLWGWAYRFEAYTPAVQRKLGYYALPLLWQGQVLGWANLTIDGEVLDARVGWMAGAGQVASRDALCRRALDDELERLVAFLGLPAGSWRRRAR